MNSKKIKEKCRVTKKMVRITMEMKKEIVEKYEDGMRIRDLATAYGKPRTTVAGIVKNKDVIKSAKVAKGVKSISKQRSVTLEHVEKLLLIWITEKQCVGCSLSEAMICEKAKLMHADLLRKKAGSSHESEVFKASHGWFDNFKKRAGIHGIGRQGKRASPNKDAGNTFITKFGEISQPKDDNSNESSDFTAEDVIIKEEDNYSDNEYADEPSYSRERGDDPTMMNYLVVKHEELPIEICNIKCEPEFRNNLDVSLPKSNTKKRKLDKTEESTEDDEFECFGSNVAAQLRSLPLHIALQTQIKLMAVLVEARLTAQQGQ